MITILLVEDDKSLADTLKYYLEQEKFKVILSNRVSTAKIELEKENLNLIILDINLPDGNGCDLCTHIRKDMDIPIIFLTALDEEENIVKGLEIGADDYITKPFRAKELITRINTILRRTNKMKSNNYQIKDVIVDAKQFKVYKKDKEVNLTTLEFRLLLYLFENKNQVLTREQILQNLWDNYEKFVNDNTLTVYIKRIRSKIEDNILKPSIIKTIKNIGYIVSDDNV